MRRRKHPLEDLDRDIREYIEQEAQDNIDRGMAPEEARYAAIRKFGNVTRMKEDTREVWTMVWLEQLVQDVRFAVRMLRKSPGFASAAILTLALGIGANTAIFTVIHSVLLSPLPYANSQELVTWRSNESQMDIDDIRAQADIFSTGGGVNPTVVTYTGETEPVGVHAGYVDGGLFPVLGVPPMLGRPLTLDDNRFGAPRVVVVAYQFWREYLGGDANAVGKTIALDGNRYEVIGVMPASFAVPQFELDLYVPLRVAYADAARYRGVHFMNTYWRLKQGVTLGQAATRMKTISARMAKDYPGEERGHERNVVPLQESVTGDVRPALLVLWAAVCVVLLIACANFAGLLLARAEARRREMVIRAALGGGRRRLIAQALTESTLLALAGGALALGLAAISIRALEAAKPAALAHLNALSVNGAVVGFGITVSMLTGVIFGLAPAWSASRANVAESMKQEGRGATAGKAGLSFRKALVTAEIAMALVLLTGTGLLVRSFERLRSVDPGFDPARVLAVRIQLPAARYEQIPKQLQFRRALLDRLNVLPGMQAAMAGDAPLTGNEVTHNVQIEGSAPVAEGDEPEIDTICVMGDYFGVMRIPMRAGRTFTPLDDENHPPVAVINEAVARKYFPGEDPVGRRLRWAREQGPPHWMTIVGVVADVKQFSLAEPAYPTIFTPFAQTNESWRRWMSVVVRLPDATGSQIPAIKREVWALDPQIPLNRIENMDELMGLSLAERQFNMSLIGLFAALSVALVAVGIYGVTAYNVSQRMHEMGIRVAVGARRLDVLKLVMGEGARMAAVGTAAGIAGAMGLTRLMTKLLYSVSATDPLTFAAVVALMMAVVLAACYVPARRAMRVDPMVALRYE